MTAIGLKQNKVKWYKGKSIWSDFSLLQNDLISNREHFGVPKPIFNTNKLDGKCRRLKLRVDVTANYVLAVRCLKVGRFSLKCKQA